MTDITTIEALEEIYGMPSEAARIKVAPRLTPAYCRWIERSRFCLVATVGPEGTDCSPRGDVGPVADILDETTLAMPDWRGNNRIDSLRNIVRDGRMSITFMVPGSANVVRVNGHARLTVAPAMIARFQRDGAAPRSVMVMSVSEVYIQCARAILRSGLWTASAAPEDLPSLGDILSERSDGALDGRDYDLKWSDRARDTMW